MSTSNPPAPRNNAAFITALLLMLFHGVLAAIVFVIERQIGVVQMRQAGTALLLIAIVCGIGALIIKWGRKSLGGWLIIAAITLLIPWLSLTAAYIGWASLIAIPLMTIWVAWQTLPNRLFTFAIILGVISGITALLIDIFRPNDQTSFPLAEFIIPAILVALLFIISLILVQRFQTFTLQTKILILFLIVAMIPLGILAAINNQITRNTFTETANQTLFTTGSQTANQIDTFIEDTKQTLQAEAQFTGLREYLTNVANGDYAFSTDAAVALATLASKDPAHILTYALLDRDGGVHVTYPVTPVPQGGQVQGVQVVDVVPPFMGVNYATETGMRSSMASSTPYASPVLFDEENQASIYFVTPVYDILDHTTPVGLLLVEYDAIILQEILESQNGLAGVDSFGVLFDEHQLHIAHGTDPSTLYKTVAPLPADEVAALIEEGRLPNVPYEEHTTNLPALSEELSNADNEPFFSAIDVATGDRTNQVAVVKTNSRPWQVGFFQPQDVYLSIANQQTRNTIILVLIIAIAVALSSVGATRILVAPINTLTELVEFIAAGDLSLQAPVITRDEIGRLAIAFNAMTAQVRNLLSGLETQVIERTQELEKQAIQLQTAAEVARDASNLQELGELLDRTVHLIHDRFGFYHAGLFLLDERQEFAVLRATNSEGGKEMIRRGHKLRVGHTGIVGYVTSTGEPRIARDVDSDAAHFAHPLLPDTQSEMALPLMVGNRIIGALDVQSLEPNAFDEGDVAVLQVLADQLAVAIENTRLLTEVRQSVHELQSAYGQYTQDSWQRWIQLSSQSTGYRYRGADIEPTDEQPPEAVLALKQGKTITKILDEESQSSLAIPIRLRDQTFGVINVRFEGDEIPSEMVSLVNSITNRLATALESARLYEETQRRAVQEQLTSEIAGRFRESLDIDAILKTAAHEIGQNFGLHDITIQLTMDNNSTPEKEEA